MFEDESFLRRGTSWDRDPKRLKKRETMSNAVLSPPEREREGERERGRERERERERERGR